MIKTNNLKVLFFGDVIGKIGRRALVKAVPNLRKKYEADLVIVNVENLAHGKGITRKTWNELIESGIDFATSGNHIFKKPEGVEMLDEDIPIIRPANYAHKTPGKGYKIIETAKGPIMIVNLLGQLFIKDEPVPTNPFTKLADILANAKPKKVKMVIVDFHAEATSEKVALGRQFDGEVSAVLGTHTHIPTADMKILPKGTGYITDVGMVGDKNSILGGQIEPILDAYMNKERSSRFEISENGICLANFVYLEIDTAKGLTRKIKRLDKEIVV
ncbi:MAG: TIGR00282 family metallophosphoesterase [Patescibacteria group bacterium]|jgi:hypothetical protein